MSCKISTAPINLSTNTRESGGSQTDFSYDYGLTNCKLTNKSTYIDIECYDGVNKTEYEDIGYLDVTGVKLFRPSLNTFNGEKAEAELIITHIGGGRHLYVCIPITSSESEGASANWFSQIMNHVPTNSQKVSVNVSNFSLNNVIPKAPFFIFNNGTFNWGCNNNDVMIIFDKKNAISMKIKDYNLLSRKIKPASYSVNENPEYVRYNKNGTKSGPGSKAGNKAGKQLTCTPITDQDGNNLEGKSMSWVSDMPEKNSNNTDFFKSEAGKYLIIIIAIVVGVLLVVLLGFAMHKLFKKNKTSVPNAPQGG